MSLFKDPEAHPLLLKDELNKKYSDGSWKKELEGETIFTDLAREPDGDIPEGNKQKIQALRGVLSTDLFWNSWPDFTNMVLALNGIIPEPSTLERPTLSELAFAVQTARVLRPEMIFDDEVCTWIAAEALEESVPWLCLPLSFVNPYLNPRVYHCRSCGCKSEIPPELKDEHVICETCSGVYRTMQPFDITCTDWGKKNMASGAGVGKALEIKRKYPEASTVQHKFTRHFPSAAEVEKYGGLCAAAIKDDTNWDGVWELIPVAKLLTMCEYLYEQNQKLEAHRGKAGSAT
jgi:hypothetical protein